jgi:excinuclease ABC subunit A
LYAKIGKTYSPVSGKVVQKQEVSDVIDYIKTLDRIYKNSDSFAVKRNHKNKLETLAARWNTTFVN